MTDDTSTYIQIGDILQEGDQVDPNGTSIAVFRLLGDGSRRMTLLYPDRPSDDLDGGGLNPGDLVPAKYVGATAVPNTLTGVTVAQVQSGRYMPLFSSSIRTRSSDLTTTPVNPVPYSLTMKQHLSAIAHDMAESPLSDIFQHESHLTGFSPHNISLTTDEQARFELVTKNIRRLVGALWQKVVHIDGLDHSNAQSWQNALVEIWPLVERLCQHCSGRGWKRKLLRHVDVVSWTRRFAAAQGGTFFFDSTENSIEAGSNFDQTYEEETANIPNFVNALKYAEATRGDEADIHLDAVTTGIAAINAAAAT